MRGYSSIPGELLADTAFAGDQDRGVEPGDPGGELEGLAEGGAANFGHRRRDGVLQLPIHFPLVLELTGATAQLFGER